MTRIVTYVTQFTMRQVSILREQCHALERQRVSLLDQCASLNRKAADAEAEMQVTCGVWPVPCGTCLFLSDFLCRNR